MGKLYTAEGAKARLSIDLRKVREQTVIDGDKATTTPEHTEPVLTVTGGSIASTGASGITKVLEAREVRLSQSDVNAWRDRMRAAFGALPKAEQARFANVGAFALADLQANGFATSGQPTDRASAIDSLFAEDATSAPAEGVTEGEQPSA